jgi:hypothetical protein
MRIMKRALAALAAALLVYLTAPAAEKDDGGVVVDKVKRTVTIDARIAPRKIDDPRYKEVYPIEVIACWAFPRGQKAHETVVTIEAKPSAVHRALESLGLKPGAPARGDSTEPPRGPEVNVYLEVPAEANRVKRLPIEKVLIDPKTNKAMPKMKWRFTGSVLSQPDPNKPEKVYGADLTGTLIAIFPVTDQTVFQTHFTMKEEKHVKLETNKKLLPAVGTPVKLVLEVPGGK